MEIKRKPTAWAVLGIYVVWTGIVQPIWNLNIERAAEKRKLDTALIDGGAVMEWLRWLASYVPSSFGLGFALGALIFAYWDALIPYFRRYVRGQQLQSTDALTVPSVRAWVGTMSVHFDRARISKEGCAQLYLTVINVGDTPFRIGAVKGCAIFDCGGATRKKINLTTPTIQFDLTEKDPLAPRYYGALSLTQPLPPNIIDLMPDCLSWIPRCSIDFSNLYIELVGEDGSRDRLKLWDGILLKGGDYQAQSSQYSLMNNTKIIEDQ